MAKKQEFLRIHCLNNFKICANSCNSWQKNEPQIKKKVSHEFHKLHKSGLKIIRENSWNSWRKKNDSWQKNVAKNKPNKKYPK